MLGMEAQDVVCGSGRNMRRLVYILHDAGFFIVDYLSKQDDCHHQQLLSTDQSHQFVVALRASRPTAQIQRPWSVERTSTR
jgi:hypothetical protein